jgi:hypothetical protein
VTIGQLNGVAIALTYAVVNSVLAVLLAFGITLTQDESAAVLAFVNNALVLVAYVAHVGAKHTKAVIPAPPIDESHE